MIKKFSRLQVAAIKRTMKNIQPLMRKLNSLTEKRNALQDEIDTISNQIAAYKQLMEPITNGIEPDIIIANNGIVEISEGDPIENDENLYMCPASTDPLAEAMEESQAVENN